MCTSTWSRQPCPVSCHVMSQPGHTTSQQGHHCSFAILEACYQWNALASSAGLSWIALLSVRSLQKRKNRGFSALVCALCPGSCHFWSRRWRSKFCQLRRSLGVHFQLLVRVVEAFRTMILLSCSLSKCSWCLESLVVKHRDLLGNSQHPLNHRWSRLSVLRGQCRGFPIFLQSAMFQYSQRSMAHSERKRSLWCGTDCVHRSTSRSCHVLYQGSFPTLCWQPHTTDCHDRLFGSLKDWSLIFSISFDYRLCRNLWWCIPCHHVQSNKCQCPCPHSLCQAPSPTWY